LWLPKHSDEIIFDKIDHEQWEKDDEKGGFVYTNEEKLKE